MRSIYTALFLSLFVTSVSGLAQTRREDEPHCSDKGPKKVEITDADATILGFEIGHSSLKDIQVKLGHAKISRLSREEESDVSICYVSPADGTVLVFYSGVMGGGTDITWFAVWSREARFLKGSQCTKSNLVSREMTTASGLGLGLTRETWERKLHGPTHSGRTSITYEYICRSKMTEEEIKGFRTRNNWDVTNDPYFDRMSWIEAQFADSRTSRLEVGRIESY